MASITNYEMDGFPIVDQNLDAYTAIRKVWMAWDDRDTFIAELVATDGLYPYNPSSGATVYRARIEKMPGTALSALGGTGLVEYGAAVVTLWYSTSAPRYWSNLFYTEAIEPYKEFHTIEGRDASNAPILEWGSDGVDIHEGLGVLLASHIYAVTFYRATAIPANFYAANGYCNASQVVCYSLGTTYAAQTLLHADPRAKRSVILGGANRWTLSYHWIFRGANEATWNKKWRPQGGGGWDTVQLVGAGPQVVFHPTVEFSTLVP